MKAFAVFVLVVATCVSTSSALRCYSCIFPGEDKCQDASGLQPKECDELTQAEKLGSIKAVCFKSVIDVKGVKQITRSCTRQGFGVTPCSAIKDGVEFCDVCEGELCNGSTGIFASIWSLMMPLAVALFMKYF